MAVNYCYSSMRAICWENLSSAAVANRSMCPLDLKKCVAKSGQLAACTYR